VIRRCDGNHFVPSDGIVVKESLHLGGHFARSKMIPGNHELFEHGERTASRNLHVYVFSNTNNFKVKFMFQCTGVVKLNKNRNYT